MEDSTQHESYHDENGVAHFALDPETGTCISATVHPRLHSERFTYFAVDHGEAFLPTREDRKEWARSRLRDLAR